MKFFAAKPWCLSKVGVFSWIHVVDCVSCANGQTMCLDAYHTQWTPRRKHDNKAAKRISHAVRWLRAFVVSARLISATDRSECP